jgi:RNA polymerase sporulation-specific sigma factor
VDFRRFNDYEIIDLIRQGNEDAWKLMFEKYRWLIAKKITQFNLTSEFDDRLQEGLMVLHKSIVRFDDRHNKSFTRYFESNLEHYYITVVRARQRQYRFLVEKMPLLVADQVRETPTDYHSEADIVAGIDSLSSFERTIFSERMIHRRSASEIARTLCVPPKKVYNAVERIKKKIKMRLDP